jgi:hypothetical protein
MEEFQASDGPGGDSRPFSFGGAMTDLEAANEFFGRLARKGFPAVFVRVEDDGPSWDILGPDGRAIACFDFHTDESFYRMSGLTSGFWQDEIDWKKYGV